MTANTVFVTGAAAGIGRSICEKFAQNGWVIAAADIDINGLKQLQDQLGKDVCSTYELNVTDSVQWENALKDFVKSQGHLNILVNNAGILSSGEFSEISIANQQRIININVGGVLNGCHAAFSYLQETAAANTQYGARVINLASASAIYGQPLLATYSTSKFAIKGLTEALNLEWEKYDIRVMDMLPMFVQTQMVQNMDTNSIKNMGVHLTPADVADKIYHAATIKGRRNKAHWTVGTATYWMYIGAKIGPDWINRAINKWLSRKK
ncbi:MAG: SDR family oxidoreductase [Oleibacter sp.]|nr:SDR family oxidoreductase [Thalassolituus sp.]